MVKELTEELQGYQWEMPIGLEIPPDKIRARLDFYQDSIFFYLLKDKVIQTKMISARDLTMALLHEVPMSSGLLPQGTLWWRQSKAGPEFALWRPSGVWKAALMLEAFKPPRRFKLPLPGLIFVCSPGRQPRIYAAKKRPVSQRDVIYHAPLFNVFSSGDTCAGTHKFPPDVSEIPESFFTSFFTKEAQYNDRSKKYPKDLLQLWEELDGKAKYPLKDLVRIGTIKDILQ
ncbi:MAG: hypothetical protein HQ588_02640 [Deltaproteobacteria bacterium]|nr:hypothetical protein [Deltaproteobacteria bacterium]